MDWLDRFTNRLRRQKQHLIQESSNYWRFYRNVIIPSTEIVNQKEIRILGLQRTGNHAIIVWIRGQHPEYSWHLNHPPSGQNPYQSLYSHFKKPKLYQEARGNFTPKSLLLLTYEDRTLREVCSPKFEKFHDVYVGISASRFDLLILRDPFNLMASRIQSNISRMSDRSARKAIQLWKTYAREFLGETKFLTQNKVCINFNQWHCSWEYRKKIAEELGLEFTDTGRERIKGYGGGSSFDKRDLDGRASELKVLNRWQTFEEVESFWQLFRDEELIDYTKRIFDRETLPFERIK